MNNTNPLYLTEISTRTLLKKRSRYTPEQWRRMMDRLQQIGKKQEEVTDPILRRAGIKTLPSGGLHGVEEYGRRMKNGQLHRARVLTRRNGRKVEFTKNPEKGASYTAGMFEDNLNLPEDKIKSELYSNTHSKNPLKRLRGWYNNLYYKHYNKNKGKSQSINNALITHHEVEELSKGLKHARRNNLAPNDYSVINSPSEEIKKIVGSHNPEVLKAEKKASDIIETLYGPEYGNPIIRNKQELAHNAITSKYTDEQKIQFVKDKIAEIRSKHPDAYVDPSEIKTIEDAYRIFLDEPLKRQLTKKEITFKVIEKRLWNLRKRNLITRDEYWDKLFELRKQLNYYDYN